MLHLMMRPTHTRTKFSHVLYKRFKHNLSFLDFDGRTPLWSSTCLHGSLQHKYPNSREDRLSGSPLCRFSSSSPSLSVFFSNKYGIAICQKMTTCHTFLSLLAKKKTCHCLYDLHLNHNGSVWVDPMMDNLLYIITSLDRNREILFHSIQI